MTLAVPTIIRVNKDNIERHRKVGSGGPVVSVFRPDGSVESGMGAVISGPSQILWRFEDYSVWVETNAEVEVVHGASQ